MTLLKESSSTACPEEDGLRPDDQNFDIIAGFVIPLEPTCGMTQILTWKQVFSTRHCQFWVGVLPNSGKKNIESSRIPNIYWRNFLNPRVTRNEWVVSIYYNILFRNSVYGIRKEAFFGNEQIGKLITTPGCIFFDQWTRWNFQFEY